MHDVLADEAYTATFGVAGALERAAEEDAAYAPARAALERLATMSPGVDYVRELTAASALPMNTRLRTELYACWERQRSWTEAQAMSTLVDVMGCPDSESDRWVTAETARTVHLSERSVACRVDQARHVAHCLGDTWTALSLGRISTAHMHVMVTSTVGLPTDLAQRVEQEVLPRAIARGWTPSKLGEAARTAIAKLDPGGAEERARKAKRATSGVWLRPDADMMATLIARNDAWTQRQIMDEINRRADALRESGDERSLDELRAEALRQALLDDDFRPGQDSNVPARGPKRMTGHLLIPLSTLLGGTTPGRLDGYGAITASMARTIAAGDIRFRRLVFDPLSGKPVDLGTESYALSPALRRWIEARDRTCRFPGCDRRAVFCDADHAVEFPVGETSCGNCGLLCRRHHNFKTSRAFRLVRHDDDSVEWSSPNGHRWRVPAATYEEFIDEPDPPPA